MTDAERLMRGFVEQVAEEPVRIAPERSGELNAQLYSDGISELICVSMTETNFWADPQTKRITATFSGMLSIWATAYAAIIIADEG